MDKVAGVMFLAIVLGLVVLVTTPTAPSVTDPAVTLEVGLGKTFDIAFEADHSTGWTWVLMTVTDRVEMIGGSYVEEAGEFVGIEHKNFKALRTGSAELRFAYIDLERGIFPSDERREFQIDIR